MNTLIESENNLDVMNKNMEVIAKVVLDLGLDRWKHDTTFTKEDLNNGMNELLKRLPVENLETATTDTEEEIGDLCDQLMIKFCESPNVDYLINIMFLSNRLAQASEKTPYEINSMLEQRVLKTFIKYS